MLKMIDLNTHLAVAEEVKKAFVDFFATMSDKAIPAERFCVKLRARTQGNVAAFHFHGRTHGNGLGNDEESTEEVAWDNTLALLRAVGFDTDTVDSFNFVLTLRSGNVQNSISFDGKRVDGKLIASDPGMDANGGNAFLAVLPGGPGILVLIAG